MTCFYAPLYHYIPKKSVYDWLNQSLHVHVWYFRCLRLVDSERPSFEISKSLAKHTASSKSATNGYQPPKYAYFFHQGPCIIP